MNGSLLVTGGLAFRWHAARNGIAIEYRAINDVDIVVAGLCDLTPALAQEFLIVHFHPARAQGRILIQLVDESQRMRIDVFTPASPALITRAQAAEVCGVPCNVIAAEDLAAKLLAVLYGVTDGGQVDPKHYEKFRRLARFIDRGIMRELWVDYRKPDYPESFELAEERVHRTIANDPTVLRPAVYDVSLDAVCGWCENDNSYSISSRTRVFEVLGYL